MARATATKTKTGFRMLVGEAVGTVDHPLGSTALTDGFSQVAPPSASAEGDPNSEQEDSAPKVQNLLGNE
jgi:hypothetical protein